MMRPVLARTSSAASGLRFCGMIEEPVVNLSDSFTSAVSGEVQITISSASRDRCTAVIEAAASVSMTKSRSETASSEFAAGRAKPSAFAVMSRSRSNEVPASAAAPSGDSLRRAARVGKAAAVARRHFHVSQQMVAEGHRLRGLQMRQPRHHRAGMLQRLASPARADRPASAASSASMQSRIHSRKSVATWSLRERAVCRRPEASPISSPSRLSTFIWMSSSARLKENLPPSISTGSCRDRGRSFWRRLPQ